MLADEWNKPTPVAVWYTGKDRLFSVAFQAEVRVAFRASRRVVTSR